MVFGFNVPLIRPFLRICQKFYIVLICELQEMEEELTEREERINALNEDARDIKVLLQEYPKDILLGMRTPDEDNELDIMPAMRHKDPNTLRISRLSDITTGTMSEIEASQPAPGDSSLEKDSHTNFSIFKDLDSLNDQWRNLYTSVCFFLLHDYPSLQRGMHEKNGFRRKR